MYTGIHQRQLCDTSPRCSAREKVFSFQKLERYACGIIVACLCSRNTRNFRWYGAPYAIVVALARHGDDWMRNLWVKFSAFWRESWRCYDRNSFHAWKMLNYVCGKRENATCISLILDEDVNILKTDILHKWMRLYKNIR